MKRELPILFSTPMVIAIQREVDPKTQTRRANGFGVINESPDRWKYVNRVYKKVGDDDKLFIVFVNESTGDTKSVKIPYKQGDILYVREAYYNYGYWEEDGYTKTGKRKWRFRSLNDPNDKYYVADYKFDGLLSKDQLMPNTYRKRGWYKRLARFMPYSFARIKLEVTGIGVERLKDISEDDAKSEGIERLLQSRMQLAENGPLYRDYMKLPEMFNDGLKARKSFFSIWESINGKESLDSNPFVFVIKFKKI